MNNNNIYTVAYKHKCWYVNQSDDLTNVFDSCEGLWKRCSGNLCNSWATGSLITFDLPNYILLGRVLMALGLALLCFAFSVRDYYYKLLSVAVV